MERTIIPWRHSPIDSNILKELTKKSDWKALAHLLLHISITVLLGIFSYKAFFSVPLYFSIPLYLLFTNIFNFLGQSAAVHEMSHGTVFKTKVLNNFFIRVIGFFTWSDFVFYTNSHRKHHQYTAHSGLEMEVILPMKLQLRSFLYSLIGNTYISFRTFCAYVRRAFGVIKGDWEEQIFPLEEKKKRQELIRWNRILIFGHLFIAVLIILSGKYLLLLYITYPLFCSSILSQLVTLTQHTGLQPNATDPRKCCRSVKLPFFYSFLYWNMNYHIEHHMFASVPFYNLKKLHKVIKDDMPVMKSLRESYRDIIETQKRQKIEPDYHYDQPCPE